MNPEQFCVDTTELTELVNGKNSQSLRNLGGVDGIAYALETNVQHGIQGGERDIARRCKAFGLNIYREPPSKGFSHFVVQAFKEYPSILILLACAALSLVFGHKRGWYEGASTSTAVLIVISVYSISNFRQSRRFNKLSQASYNVEVEVVRSGRRQRVPKFEIVVGDVVFLRSGDQVPADGLFLDGLCLKVEEESDHAEVIDNQNPFLFSGTKVVNGCAKMLVVSVGTNTTWGQMMSSIISQKTEEKTPLQVQIKEVTSSLAKIGLVVALLALLVLLVHYFTGNTKGVNGNKEFNGSETMFSDIVNEVVGSVAAAVTIAVVAIPVWLPLAVTLTLAYSMKKMMTQHQAMVLRISACATLPSVTVICTNKTGTLTSNQMKMNKFWLGEEPVEEGSYSSISPCVLGLIQEGVALNTTGHVYKSSLSSEYEFFGTPTEQEILKWAALNLNLDVVEKWTESCTILNGEAFNPCRKRSGILMRRKSDNTKHMHWKGAAEAILAKCSTFYDASGTKKELDHISKPRFQAIIEGMAAKGLRCTAFAHVEVSGEGEEDDGVENKRLIEEGLTLLGVVGIKNPCREGVKQAVQDCRDGGIHVKLITGDDVLLAKAVAFECGILTADNSHSEAVIKGKEFSGCTEEERAEKVDKICVMAESSPFDKLLMVQSLKRKGHVVAITGKQTNDALAMKEADIAFSMGIQGPIESSNIVILEDNFCSATKVLRWGRWLYNNNKKFINVQLPANVVALAINFAAVVNEGEVPLTAVNLFWINMIIYLVGGLAIATEKPSRELMETPPVEVNKIPIDNIERRNQLALVLAQILVLLTLQLAMKPIFGDNAKSTSTLIFDGFVLYQVYNQFLAGMNPLPISQLLSFVVSP